MGVFRHTDAGPPPTSPDLDASIYFQSIIEFLANHKSKCEQNHDPAHAPAARSVGQRDQRYIGGGLTPDRKGSPPAEYRGTCEQHDQRPEHDGDCHSRLGGF